VHLKKIWLVFFILLILPTAAFSASAGKNKEHFVLKAALLVDMGSGKVLYEQDADKLIQPASLSKIMALYLVNEDLRAGRVHLSDRVKISSKAVNTGGSKMLYEEGKEVLLEDLIKGMAVLSANDATVAVAEYLAGGVDKFVERMNVKAGEMGMSRSHFINPHGLPDTHQLSTAHDILILSREYLQHFPDVLNIHSMQSLRYNSVTRRNRNILLSECADVDGLKTGYVRVAGYHLVATAKRGDVRLIAVVLGAKNPRVRAEQTKKILEDGFRVIGNKRPNSLIGA
jgi:D-alanyl-D-alanine carboxypeptidase (penicillin-binding protein 5/6)